MKIYFVTHATSKDNEEGKNGVNSDFLIKKNGIQKPKNTPAGK